LLLEVAGGIQPFRTLWHLAVIRSVPMPGATLTEVCIAGLLEAVKEFLVSVPAVATGVASFPGAKLLTRTIGAGLLTLADTCVAPATAEYSRVGPLDSGGIRAYLPHPLPSRVRPALVGRAKDPAAAIGISFVTIIVSSALRLQCQRVFVCTRRGTKRFRRT
jgi:hypothetical protein